VSVDSKLMLEVADSIGSKGVMEHTFMRRMAGKFPGHAVRRVVELMVDSKMIEFSNGKGVQRWVRKVDG